RPPRGLDGVYDIIATAGIVPEKDEFEFWTTPEDERFAEDFLTVRGVEPEAKLAGLNPGTAWRSRQWDVGNYARVGDALMEVPGTSVAIFGSREERGRAEAIAGRMRRPAVIAAGETTLRQAAALVRRCSVFVSNDSGLMHIASLSGVPTIGIFGSTDPARAALVGGASAVFHTPLECAPCYKPECRLTDAPLLCLTSIPPEAVSRKALEMMGF
ncbi:MAG: glycosyltransferase family 9 protein, partial [bacterium]